MATAITRHWIDWSRPALPAAVDWIIGHCAQDGVVDLADWIVVLPATRSRRRLLQLLARTCRDRGIALLPGRSLTVGSLPELLYRLQRPLADELQCQLAWAEAIQTVPERQLRELLPVFQRDDFTECLSLAAMLSGLHRQLGAEAASFSTVLRGLRERPGFPELRRWETLAALQDSYYQVLDRDGLWDREAARNVAIRQNECSCQQRILLVGTADLNRVLRQMLSQPGVAPRVTALVFGPPGSEGGFDGTGALAVDWWRTAPVSIPDEAIRIVDRPLDQANAVGHFIASLPDEIPTDCITVCTPDEEVAVHTLRQLEGEGLPVRRLAGVPLGGTRVGRTVAAIGEWLRQPRFEEVAALLRLPDVFDFVSGRLRESDWLDAVDAWQNAQFPSTMDLADWMPGRAARTAVDEDSDGVVGKVFRELAALLAPLLDRQPGQVDRRRRNKTTSSRSEKSAAGEPGSPGETAGLLTARGEAAISGWRAVLGSLFGGQQFSLTDAAQYPLIESLRVADSALDEIAAATGSSGVAGRMLDARDVGNLLLERLAGDSAVDNDDPRAIELAGWLDLALDDAPAVVVTGFNEHNIPSSQTGHPLLPNSICRDLGLMDNDRRFARDAWVLGMVLSARKHVWLVTGRRSGDNSPLLPSRLMFAADAETVRRRSAAWFGFRGSAAQRRWMQSPVPAAPRQTIPVPPPLPIPPPRRIAVTRLRDYVACPYRFWMAHVMKLEPSGDVAQELDGGTFGDLAHDVLQAFGESNVANSLDGAAIRDFLESTLDAAVRARWPRPLLPAVQIQIANLRRRFARFAEIQAVRRQEGWRILRVEPSTWIDLNIAGETFTITGRIDRVDEHEDGRLAIWDYKTSDSAKKAMAAHFHRQEGWLDFQLPLYRRMLASVLTGRQYDPDSVGLGYVLLPRDLDEVGFDAADWSPDELADADRAVQDILESIVACRFWPPLESPGPFDDWADVCQTDVFERWDIASGLPAPGGGGNR